MLSRYTARMPIRNSSLRPRALNSGFDQRDNQNHRQQPAKAPPTCAQPRVKPLRQPARKRQRDRHLLHREHGEARSVSTM